MSSYVGVFDSRAATFVRATQAELKGEDVSFESSAFETLERDFQQVITSALESEPRHTRRARSLNCARLTGRRC